MNDEVKSKSEGREEKAEGKQKEEEEEKAVGGRESSRRKEEQKKKPTHIQDKMNIKKREGMMITLFNF